MTCFMDLVLWSSFWLKWWYFTPSLGSALPTKSGPTMVVLLGFNMDEPPNPWCSALKVIVEMVCSRPMQQFTTNASLQPWKHGSSHVKVVDAPQAAKHRTCVHEFNIFPFLNMVNETLVVSRCLGLSLSHLYFQFLPTSFGYCE